MRMTLVIASLGCGGAERVLTTLANDWATQGRHVTLLTDAGTQTPPCYPIHPMVTLHPLATATRSRTPLHGIAANVARVKSFRRAIVASRPDVVVSFMAPINVLTLLATRGLGIPVIVSERISPAHLPIGAQWAALRRQLYPRASCLVVQTDGARAFFPPAIQRRTRVIPNPVIVPTIAAEPDGLRAESTANTRRSLLAMGRLDQQKGFDLLLRAFAPLRDQRPNWSLTIWGDGPERAALEVLRDELGLQDRVTLPGTTHEPFVQMRRADLFVLSSRYEGFPNVLTEAMACGVAVVSFDCPTGPREIIRNGVDGILVPPGDAPALSAALDRLMTDDQERRRLGQRAVEVGDRFAADRVMRLWDDAIAGARGDHP